jgi:hypothetical protein
MDHLQAIRTFARVVETGGFGRAALSLDMPNATVSKWIKSLEARRDDFPARSGLAPICHGNGQSAARLTHDRN